MRTHQKAQRLFPKNEKKTGKIAILTQFPQLTIMEIASMTIPSAASYELTYPETETHVTMNYGKYIFHLSTHLFYLAQK